MQATRSCEQCGTALPPGRLEGLCPRCLLDTVADFAFESDFDIKPEESHADPDTITARQPSRRRLFGDYELLEEIAHGGMGVVYKARQRSLNRVVAIKMLLFGEFTREEFVRRFHAEAEAAAKLQHPNIVAIHEVGQHGGQHYFSMDYVDGPDLSSAARGQPMPIARALRLVRAIAGAVHHAHEHSVLHRDLKPSNILIDAADQPHITDFGLAKDLQHDGELTLTGHTFGSPNYIPPEQAEGRHREIGPCSDVYSIGAILYHLLTGRPPFVGETLAVTLRQVAQDEPLAPRLLNPAVPRDVQTICLKCLEKEPARRYVTAQELADELGRVQRDEPIRARPIGAVEHVWRWCRRRPALASSLSAAVLFLVAGLTATSWQWRRAERHARDLRATVTRLKLDQAEERLAGGETAKGLALLAALLRENPANRVAAQRVVSVLMQRNFLRPLPGSAETWHSRWTSGFAQREHLLITTTNEGCTLTLWDTKDGLNLRRSIEVGEAVRHSDLSRDGRLLLVATQAKSLRLYDLTDGSLRAGPYPIGGFTEQLLLSPDAALGIVVAGPDEALANWRTIKGKVIRLADGQQLYEKAQFHWAAFSPNGRWVVTAHYGAAQIRDADSWEPVDEPLIEASRINTAEFSPDSSCVVTASADFNATVWNAASGDQLFRLVHPVNVQAASFSPDGTRIFTRDNANNGRIWDAAGGKLLGQAFPQQKGHGPASFSPDGRRFLSYSRNTIVLREVETSSPLAEPLVASDLPTRARFLPDGRRFVVTTMDGSTRLWDAAPTVFAPRIFPEKLEMSNGSLSPDGTKVAIAVKSNWGRIWDAETGEPVAPYLRHNPGQVTSLRWSLDSSFVVTASLDRTARIWDARTGSQRGDALQHGSSVTEVEFSPDGRWLATASEDGTVRIWSTANHEAVSPPLKHGNIVRRARFSPDGSLLGTASLDRTVRIWSVPEGREIGASMTNELEFSDVVFSPEGRRLATAGKASYAQIWDVQSRRQLTPPLRHTGYVSTVRFSPDGSRVVTTSSDGTARVWDAVTGQPVARPLRHREEVTLAEFSPGGRFVLTASMDGTARLWDVDTGHAVSDPFRHDERIVAGQWARDGKNFLTVSYDRRAKLWPIFLAPEGAVVPWLADLAEATAVLRLEGEEIFGHIPMEQVIATHKRLRTPERSDLWGEWLKSFFAPRVSRSVPQPPAEP